MPGEHMPNNFVEDEDPIASDWLYREVLRQHSDQVQDAVFQHLDIVIEGNQGEYPPEQVSDFTFPVQAQLEQN